ncbi:hypothetical protein PNOK_0869600 [Pyrrhoderma noxium]|uniref:Uncharacterized protein n=1 Tax=Pyrrhoderma noxium TaxID=2282107 RepID=A0A286U8D8_9AGAM|nr:hypothetical protein PNOK_0869600 [Pyrrhoderma noxium]
MCGRFSLGIPRAHVLRIVRNTHPELDVDPDRWIDGEAFEPRYNVAPRTRAPVIRRVNRFDDRELFEQSPSSHQDNKHENEKNEKVDVEKGTILHTMKWGLVPHWCKYEDTSLNTINARGENLLEGSGMWNSIKGRKRCGIICQGYYEWQKRGRDKVPHFTKHKDGQVMLLAGLYDSVILEGTKEALYTFTIVTTDANKQLSWLHDRMPLVLSTPAQILTWLDTSSQAWSPKVANLIRPFSTLDEKYNLVCYAVPKEIGKIGRESSTFIEPVSKRKDGIEAMFAKQKQKKPTEEEKGKEKGKEEKGRNPMSSQSRSSPSPFPSSASFSATKKPISSIGKATTTNSLKRERSPSADANLKEEDRESSSGKMIPNPKRIKANGGG